jgi:hypothetical protein
LKALTKSWVDGLLFSDKASERAHGPYLACAVGFAAYHWTAGIEKVESQACADRQNQAVRYAEIYLVRAVDKTEDGVQDAADSVRARYREFRSSSI